MSGRNPKDDLAGLPAKAGRRVARAHIALCVRYEAEGGRMHLIVQGIGDPSAFHAARRPLAMYHHGNRTDERFRSLSLNYDNLWVLERVGALNP